MTMAMHAHSGSDTAALLLPQGHSRLEQPAQMLEALRACSGRGAAAPVCALALAAFNAAGLMGMSCAEAARLGPRASLQIMLMRGPQAASVRLHLLPISAWRCDMHSNQLVWLRGSGYFPDLRCLSTEAVFVYLDWAGRWRVSCTSHFMHAPLADLVQVCKSVCSVR